jgi:hypothetical protein
VSSLPSGHKGASLQRWDSGDGIDLNKMNVIPIAFKDTVFKKETPSLVLVSRNEQPRGRTDRVANFKRKIQSIRQ